ncbi:ATP-dependent DNA ligase [Glaciibacter psychrotolerans]
MSVGGHRVTLTHLDTVIYPETGTTKADVLGYYAAVADLFIAHAVNRPATRKRWVHGVGTLDSPGAFFFQKNLDASTPEWVPRRPIQHSDHVNDYPLVNNMATLIWLAQLGALEIHVPQWQFGRGGDPRNPDRLVLDLDPGEGAGLADCAEVARLARSILRDMNLDPLPVTSGSTGIHLYAALDSTHTAAQISAVAHELARSLEADHPALVVSDMKRMLRTGKVFVDWSQNNAAKTTIAPYSLRGRSHPWVAAPRTWDELNDPGLTQLDYQQVMQRMEYIGDPLAAIDTTEVNERPTDDSAAIKATGLSPERTQDPAADPLAVYRSKRDSSRTPEPMPERTAGTGTSPATAGSSTDHSFVIHEHHARSKHYDFRLEHDGVLVSWALPKGVPTESGVNHLAVHTEDHPLEYGRFEGTIPSGEYGAGEIMIWDRGEYDLEKWRDHEVIVTVHGEPGGGLGGTKRFAIIQTAAAGMDSQNWLIHLMKPGMTAGARRYRPLPEPAAAAPARIYSPMLAAAGSPADTAEGAWAFEMKWDGMRALAALTRAVDSHGGADGPMQVRIFSRNGHDVTASYPDLIDDITASVHADSAVLDGEIVAFDRGGRPDFGLLQTRMNLTAPQEIAASARLTPVHYLVFDLLERNGQPLVDSGYDERRAELENTLRPQGRVQLPPAFLGGADGSTGPISAADALHASRDLGLEGVLAKQRDSTYSEGRRSRQWIKIKHHLSQEVVIGGWRTGTGHRHDTLGSLLLGIPDATGLRYVGRVGTGFRDRELVEILARLEQRRRNDCPLVEVPATDSWDAHWVEPDLVGEVEFAGWTSQGRLRHPSWRGWRPDKSPADVVLEQ